jgi:hypothetical protein
MNSAGIGVLARPPDAFVGFGIPWAVQRLYWNAAHGFIVHVAGSISLVL